MVVDRRKLETTVQVWQRGTTAAETPILVAENSAASVEDAVYECAAKVRAYARLVAEAAGRMQIKLLDGQKEP